jgi:competence transcription factor ComK
VAAYYGIARRGRGDARQFEKPTLDSKIRTDMTLDANLVSLFMILSLWCRIYGAMTLGTSKKDV